MYNGVLGRNIMSRVSLDTNTKNISLNFAIDRVADNGINRVDVIAENYYGSATYDWLVYLSNSVVDPYNDLLLDSESFNKFITSKYGSISLAKIKVVGYINNWADNQDDKLTIAQFNAASQSVKKYYTGVIDYYNQITEYKRLEVDWFKSTNKFNILGVSFTDYILVGAIVTQTLNGQVLAVGTVSDVNTSNSSITVQHITGEFVVNGSTVLKRATSSLAYAITSVSNPFTVDNITDEESVFWSPYTAYQMESERNEGKRNFKLLRASLRGSAEEQLTDLLRS